jgi:hypothetical protein
MNSLGIGFWSIIGLAITVGGGLLFYGRSRYREGVKDQQRKQDRKNAEAHRKAGKVMAQPRDRDDLSKRLSDGDF